MSKNNDDAFGCGFAIAGFAITVSIVIFLTFAARFGWELAGTLLR